jgi:hypothetical protein
MRRMALREALRGALERTLPWGWTYLPDVPALTPDTPCVLVDDAQCELDDRHLPVEAVHAGFPCEGLDTDTMEATGDCARNLHDPPSDELLVESFSYYRSFDAFLPSPGAAPPPSGAELQLKLDREFFDILGAERQDTPCRRVGCSRGAITLSVLCRKHHFESIRGRPCPFDD